MKSNAAAKYPEQLWIGDNKVSCRPFVKWAGGKSQLLNELIRRIPSSVDRYFEPFVGGGALFFGFQPKRAKILDINPELINTYQVIKTKIEPLIKDLKKHRHEEGYFYDLREADRTSHFKRWSDVRRASRFIYLNKTCYNGLYRVNSEGFFNTPFGRYTNPTILDETNLRACSKVLSAADVRVGSFRDIEKEVRKKDFVYFDPPYVPLSSTSYFTGYSSRGFDNAMQEELAELCLRLDRKGVRFMLSNSSSPLVLKLYNDFRIELVNANRAVNSKGDRRGPVKEVIITNYINSRLS